MKRLILTLATAAAVLGPMAGVASADPRDGWDRDRWERDHRDQGRWDRGGWDRRDDRRDWD
ncbi:hypothetical protein HUS70_22870, partial [Pandoraea nosoerga]|nr:hypothetical protein [Pandoraea nosoerga]